LSLTPAAAHMIRGLVLGANLPHGAGLRIARHDQRSWLAMSLAESAGAYDTVLTEHEAVVFLGPVARQRLTAQTLDARTGETGSAFYLRH
jgi:Fe-S cluster assembly iron-binding protein IscA